MLAPPDAHSPVRFFLSAKPGAAALPIDEVFVNPYSGQILGGRLWGDLSQGLANLMPFVYRLHHSLVLGTIGTWIFGVVALLWTLDCFVGAWLTFPTAPPRRPAPPPPLLEALGQSLAHPLARRRPQTHLRPAPRRRPLALGPAARLRLERRRPHPLRPSLPPHHRPVPQLPARPARHRAHPGQPQPTTAHRLGTRLPRRPPTPGSPGRRARPHHPRPGALRLHPAQIRPQTDGAHQQRRERAVRETWVYVDATDGKLLGYYLPTGKHQAIQSPPG